LGLGIYGLLVYASIQYGIRRKSYFADKLVEVTVLGLTLWLADRAGKAACHCFNVQSGNRTTRSVLRSNLHPGTQSLEIEVAAQHRKEMPRWVNALTALFLTALCVGCLLFLQAARTGEEKLISVMGVGLFGGLGVVGWLLLLQQLNPDIKWLTTDTIVARSDEKGVTGYNGRNMFKKKLVPWSQVARLEVTLFYDEVGELEHVQPVFQDTQRKRLLNLNLNYASPEDRDRFVRFVEHQLTG
jgi:hypothetical protein